MSLEFDTSRAVRSRADQASLVEAVYRASREEPETVSIEWKSTLDLAEARSRFQVARQILAFANREPSRAARDFEGCAYLLVGVEPGQVLGIDPHDPADLDNWISPYVGADGPDWNSTYVEIEEKHVLVVTIEPPRSGDPIHCLMKGFDQTSAGRVFTRRPGKTAEASPAEIRMLEDRAKRSGDQVALGLGFRGGTPSLRSFAAQNTSKQEWLQAEAERYMRPFNAAMAQPVDPLARGVYGDRRKPDQFEEEIRSYLELGAAMRWQQLLWEGVVHEQLAPLELEITNDTERNFEKVKVTLSLPAGVVPLIDEDTPRNLLGTGNPPLPWGKDTILGSSVVERIEFPGLVGGTEVRKVGDHYEVAMASEHVRPREPTELEPIHLALPDAFVEDTIEIGWRATSTSADGDVGGTLVAPIIEGAVAVETLVLAAEEAH